MAKKSGTDKELKWREILTRQAGSGMSVRKFCTTEGISEPSFYAWRKKVREREGGRTRPQEFSESRDELFVPLKLIDSTQTLEILHPLGYRIQLAGAVDPVALRHVIEVLDERGGQ